MRLRDYAIFALIALTLAVIEIPLEFRAYARGYQTFLLGWKGIAPSAPPADGQRRNFGPTPEFPFWSEVVPQALEPGEPRYWIASASHAAETHIPLDFIFPVVLSDICKERGRPCQVLSASEPGFTIMRSAKEIETHAAQFPPKAVVLYQMANDVIELARLAFSGAPLEPEVSTETPEANAPELSVRALTHRFVENMTSHQLLKTNMTNRVVAQRILHEELPENARAVFMKRVRTFVATARAHGIEPVLATFATSHRLEQINDFPETHRLKLFAFSRELSMPGWARTVEQLNEEIRSLAGEERLLLIDVAKEISGRHELFRDFYHFTPEGHREVARVLADALLGTP